MAVKPAMGMLSRSRMITIPSNHPMEWLLVATFQASAALNRYSTQYIGAFSRKPKARKPYRVRWAAHDWENGTVHSRLHATHMAIQPAIVPQPVMKSKPAIWLA